MKIGLIIREKNNINFSETPCTSQMVIFLETLCISGSVKNMDLFNLRRFVQSEEKNVFVIPINVCLSLSIQYKMIYSAT